MTGSARVSVEWREDCGAPAAPPLVEQASEQTNDKKADTTDDEKKDENPVAERPTQVMRQPTLVDTAEPSCDSCACTHTDSDRGSACLDDHVEGALFGTRVHTHTKFPVKRRHHITHKLCTPCAAI